MLAWLATKAAGILGEKFVSTIGKVFLDGYKLKLDATNNHELKVVELATRELALQQREAEVNADVVKAEQARWWTAMIRPAFAMPFIIFCWKVVVWDTVLGLGTTGPLRGQVGEWAGYIIIAYFGGRTIEKTASIVTSLVMYLKKK